MKSMQQVKLEMHLLKQIYKIRNNKQSKWLPLNSSKNGPHLSLKRLGSPKAGDSGRYAFADISKKTEAKMVHKLEVSDGTATCWWHVTRQDLC